MIINQNTLSALQVGFKTSFQRGLGQAASEYTKISTVVPSGAKSETYGWLGKVPNMREWIGERVINGIGQHGYTIVNKDYEATIGVNRNDIEDDNLGVYAPLFEEMGMAAAAHPDQLVWPLLAAGFATNCYDGQYFFDTDHPVLDASGAVTSVANTDGGSGTAWYLIDARRPLKPIIFQQRKAPQFVRKDSPDDDNVFMRKEFLYGTDARHNVGYGFWQFAWGSKQTLDATHYATARAAMMGMKGDYGRPLGLMPNFLVVPPALEQKARELIGVPYLAGGATNPWYNTAEVLVTPWLA